jgi:hypothetical protein
VIERRRTECRCAQGNQQAKTPTNSRHPGLPLKRECLVKTSGGVTFGAIATKAPLMHIVRHMAVCTRSQRLGFPYIGSVTRITFQVRVATVQHETRVLVMIELPPAPAIRVVTLLATRAEG